jgi:hypothetical protein
MKHKDQIEAVCRQKLEEDKAKHTKKKVAEMDTIL